MSEKLSKETHTKLAVNLLQLLGNLALEPVNSPEEFWNRALEHRMILCLAVIAYYKKLHLIDSENYTKNDNRCHLDTIFKFANTHKSITERIIAQALKCGFLDADKNGFVATEISVKYSYDLEIVRKEIMEKSL